MTATDLIVAAPHHNTPALPSADEMQQAWKLSKELIGSGFLPRAIDTPAKAVAVYLKGREMGLPFMQSMGNIHIVEGRPAASAELMMNLAFTRVKGFGVKILQADDKACSIEFRREGSEPFTYTYSIDDAKTAGLSGKAVWKNHPAPMLAARCKAQGLRLYCPDATNGLSAIEELLDEPGGTPRVTPLPKPRPAAAAAAKQAEIKADAEQSLAEVLDDSRAGEGATDEAPADTDDAPATEIEGLDAEGKREVLAQGGMEAVTTAFAALRHATKGAREFYGLAEGRLYVKDGEMLTTIGSLKNGAPVNAWLDKVASNDAAWGKLCGAIIKVAEELGVEVVS